MIIAIVCHFQRNFFLQLFITSNNSSLLHTGVPTAQMQTPFMLNSLELFLGSNSLYKFRLLILPFEEAKINLFLLIENI